MMTKYQREVLAAAPEPPAPHVWQLPDWEEEMILWVAADPERRRGSHLTLFPLGKHMELRRMDHVVAPDGNLELTTEAWCMKFPESTPAGAIAATTSVMVVAMAEEYGPAHAS
jgi:hypothetical protein